MNKWTLVLVLAIAQFVMVLDSTVMNVSISQVVEDLDTSVSALQTAITFYTLTMAAFMLTGGKLGDKLGRLKAFKIGSIIYGLGSLLTAISPSIGVLFLGWSVIEGLGAVLVIPAIAALIAMNYKGKDRVKAYTIIGAVSGIAVALGPLIGGYLTTYYSWRYVFAAETIIMIGVLLYAFKLKPDKPDPKTTIDIPSVLLSVSGMTILVYGILQSKTWGWILPKSAPVINREEFTPLGISVVAYMIIIGLFILWKFANRQMALESQNRMPLLRVTMLKIPALKSGLTVLGGQYFVTAATFFILPIYLQMVLGLDALETGKKLFPLSVSIIIFSGIGSRMVNSYSPKKIVRFGQICLMVGVLGLTGSINPEMQGFSFGLALFVVGAGLGLLASQLGNVTMSAVEEDKSSEVGGLQGTFQNLGSSLGTAIIGSVMIASLSSGFVTLVQANPELPDSVKSQAAEAEQKGIPIVSASDVESSALEAGLSQAEATSLSEDYQTAQIDSLKSTLFFLFALSVLTLTLSKNIPDKKIV